MLKLKAIQIFYKYLLRPLLFMFDAEHVHTIFMIFGEFLGKHTITRKLLTILFKSPDLNLVPYIVYTQMFPNRIGLAAGFDYDGRLANVFSSIGFGFNTVGTVTARPYSGNAYPRLGRLIKSRSLFVNKGFKSLGAKKVGKILDKQNLKSSFIGVSIGSSNVPEVNTVDLAIADYIETFYVLKDRDYIRYFELNISCPNIVLKNAFTDPTNFRRLLVELKKLEVTKPVFVKMPSEISYEVSDSLVSCAIEFDIYGFIFSNLVKNRSNPHILPNELERYKDLPGNFSGKPVEDLSNKLIKHTRQQFGDSVFLIGCGGIFSYEDASRMFNCGADLVQLITGMIFEGPQLPSQINMHLSRNSKN